MASMRRQLPLIPAAWLVAALVFAVAAVFAASNDRFPGDLWLTREIQGIDGESLTACSTGPRTSPIGPCWP